MSIILELRNGIGLLACNVPRTCELAAGKLGRGPSGPSHKCCCYTLAGASVARPCQDGKAEECCVISVSCGICGRSSRQLCENFLYKAEEF